METSKVEVTESIDYQFEIIVDQPRECQKFF